MAVPGATLTAQYVLDRASAFSPANPALMTNTVEMLSRVRYKQREVFTQVAMRARELFVATAEIPSSTGGIGGGGRTLDLSVLVPPLERVLQLDNNGTVINQVDVLDLAGELAPRYYAEGLTLVEVNSEWDTVPGSTTMTVTYCYAPTDINPLGDTTQPLSVPDGFVDILVGDLAAYLALKDYGRAANEVQVASALATTRLAEFQAYLDQTAGVRAMRTDIPHPTGTPK